MSHQTPNNINLREPTPADVSKLHSEINQYINQRLTVTTTAITIFGVFTGWMVTQDDIKDKIPQIPLALLAIIAVLFLYCQVILWNIRIIASYLRVTGKSTWERAYDEYYNKQKKNRLHLDQDNLFKLTFAFLGFLNGILCLLLDGFSCNSIMVFIVAIIYSWGVYKIEEFDKLVISNETADENWTNVFEASDIPLADKQSDRLTS